VPPEYGTAHSSFHALHSITLTQYPAFCQYPSVKERKGRCPKERGGSAPRVPSALNSLPEVSAATSGRGEHKPPPNRRAAIYPSPHLPGAAVSDLLSLAHHRTASHSKTGSIRASIIRKMITASLHPLSGFIRRGHSLHH